MRQILIAIMRHCLFLMHSWVEQHTWVSVAMTLFRFNTGLSGDRRRQKEPQPNCITEIPRICFVNCIMCPKPPAESTVIHVSSLHVFLLFFFDWLNKCLDFQVTIIMWIVCCGKSYCCVLRSILQCWSCFWISEYIVTSSFSHIMLYTCDLVLKLSVPFNFYLNGWECERDQKSVMQWVIVVACSLYCSILVSCFLCSPFNCYSDSLTLGNKQFFLLYSAYWCCLVCCHVCFYPIIPSHFCQ